MTDSNTMDSKVYKQGYFDSNYSMLQFTFRYQMRKYNRARQTNTKQSGN